MYRKALQAPRSDLAASGVAHAEMTKRVIYLCERRQSALGTHSENMSRASNVRWPVECRITAATEHCPALHI
eukprot:4462806-Pleurochrysis_carterae.AAC.7